jgi:hypothetical protein
MLPLPVEKYCREVQTLVARDATTFAFFTAKCWDVEAVQRDIYPKIHPILTRLHSLRLHKLTAHPRKSSNASGAIAFSELV